MSRSEQMEVALNAIGDTIADLHRQNPKMDDADSMRVAIAAIAGWTKHALRAPRRNCDVGTPEEQWTRWHRNCGHGIPNCKHCKVYAQGKESGLVGDRGFLRCGCEFIWAQMPYEADDEKKGVDDEQN